MTQQQQQQSRRYNPPPTDNVFAHNVSRYLLGVDSFGPFFALAVEYFQASQSDPTNLPLRTDVNKMILQVATYTHVTVEEVRQTLVRAANTTNTNPTNPEDF